jgi:hypothetical protein
VTEDAVSLVQRHLAQGDLAAARAALDRIEDAALLACDFAACGPIFREAGFKYGESRLAGLYRQRYPNDVRRRLLGAETMIRLGAEDAALRELRDIAEMDDVRGAVERFWAACKSMGRLDVAEPVAERLAAAGALTQQLAIAFGFDLLERYDATSQKGLVARQLIDLRALCRGDSTAELRLVDACIRMRHMVIATDIMATLEAPPDAALTLTLYRAQCLSVTDFSAARRQIDALLAQADGDFRFWMKVTHAAEPLAGAETAIEAARRAMACALRPSQRTQAGQRIAQLYISAGKPGSAIPVLTELLDSPDAATPAAQDFAHLARSAGDTGLALRFADGWRAAAPETIAAQLTYCQFLIVAGRLREAEAALRRFLADRVADPLVSRKTYARLIGLAEKVDFSLLQDACAQAVRACPGDHAFKSQLTADPFLGRFYSEFQGQDTSPL